MADRFMLNTPRGNAELPEDWLTYLRDDAALREWIGRSALGTPRVQFTRRRRQSAGMTTATPRPVEMVVHLKLRISKNLRIDLERVAARNERNLSAEVRRALRQYIEREDDAKLK